MEIMVSNSETRLLNFAKNFTYCTVQELKDMRVQYLLCTKMDNNLKENMIGLIDKYIFMKRFFKGRS
jgi:hypothetical protein